MQLTGSCSGIIDGGFEAIKVALRFPLRLNDSSQNQFKSQEQGYFGQLKRTVQPFSNNEAYQGFTRYSTLLISNDYLTNWADASNGAFCQNSTFHRFLKFM